MKESTKTGRRVAVLALLFFTTAYARDPPVLAANFDLADRQTDDEPGNYASLLRPVATTDSVCLTAERILRACRPNNGRKSGVRRMMYS